MKAYRLLIVLLALSPFMVHAQVSSSVTGQDASCYNVNDGSITVELEGCYAPLSAVLGNDTVLFESLYNDEIYSLLQGAATDTAVALDVWSGMTSAGPMVVTTGFFEDSITFESTTLISNGLRDMWLTAHDTAGALLWATSAGSPTFDEGSGVVVYDDHVYLVGYFGGSMNLGGVTINNIGTFDGYVAKYDLLGNAVAGQQFGASGITQLRKITAHDTALYISGNHTGTVTAGGSTVSSTGGYDILALCVDTALNGTWALQGGSPSQDFAFEITVDTNGGTVNHIYMTGEFQSTATFGGTSVTSGGQANAIVLRATPQGSWDWAVAGSSSTTASARGLQLSENSDSVYVSGYYPTAITFGTQSITTNGQYDAFVLVLDTSGIATSLTTFGGSTDDFGLDLERAGNGYLVLSGQFTGSMSLNYDTLTSQGGFDGFMIKLRPSKIDIWSKSLGGIGDDSYAAIHESVDGLLVGAGVFENTIISGQDSLVSLNTQDAFITIEDLFGVTDSFTFTNVSGGDYAVLSFDAAGNTGIDSITIGPPQIIISGVITPASSGTSMDGAIDLTVTGGVPTYQYDWSTLDTVADLDSLMIGTYTVTVTDTSGCTETATFVIDTSSSPLSLDTSFVTPVLCFGDSTGAIDLTVSGGLMPYTFVWSNGDSTQNISGLTAGTYFVTISDTGTVITDSFIVVQNAPILLSNVNTPPSSGTSNDGAIDLTVSGGTPGYTYMWSTGDTIQDLDSMMVGIYTVTVTDALGCTEVLSVPLDTLPALSLFLLATDVTCLNTTNGTVDLTVVGGVPPFTYAWSNAATTEDISGLSAGMYIVIVTDSFGQTATDTATVGSNPTQPDPVIGALTGPATAQSWISYNYSVQATNGSQFQWDALGGVVQSTASNLAIVQWNAGPNGTLIVQETDAIGCTAVDTFGVSILFVGIGDANSNAIAVFPNPAVDFVNIQMPESHSNAIISMFDLNGRQVAAAQQINGSGQLSVSNLSAGLYVLHIKVDEIELTQEIVIQQR